jgi:hypothetical protein
MKRQSALSVGLAVLALGAAGCGGSSSSTSSGASSASTPSTTTGALQPKTAVSPKPTRVILRVGQTCTTARQRTYLAHGLLCVNGRLHKVKRVHTTSGGSGHTSTGGSSGGAGIPAPSSGGAPVSSK